MINYIAEVLHEYKGYGGKFFILLDNKEVAEMTYSSVGPECIVVDYTYIDESLAGSDISKLLIMKAFEYARQQGFKIIPLCPFARHEFQKTPNIGDVYYYIL